MNIWIFNAYNMPLKYGHLNRSFYFEKFLTKKAIDVKVFVNSCLHNGSKNIVDTEGLFKTEGNCVFVKTDKYKGNGFGRIKSMFQYYFDLFKISDEFERPDVIIGSSVHPLACVAAIKLSKKYKCKNIVEIRDLWPETLVSYGIIGKNNPITKILYKLEKWIYKKADKIIFTMEGGKNYIVEKGWDKDSGGPVDINKIYHINNGVDLEVFDYNKENYKIDDEDLKNKDIFKVVYTGSIRFANNLGVLVKVAERLKEQGYNKIKLLIWGKGDRLESLRQEVKDKKLDNIVFKGYVEKKYVPYIVSDSDVNILHGDSNFWNVARFGVSLNKLFDYLAGGKPILSSIVCNYDVVSQNKAGITIKKQTVENIADEIIKFYNMPKDEYEEMCKNARKLSYEYDFKNLTDKLIDIIEEE